jgi:hypothetical protein
MTKSEVLFESLCAASAIRAERIHVDRRMAPDYMLWSGNASIVIKVKQFDAMPADQRTSLSRPDEIHESDAFYDSVPGERVRSKIDSAIPQFKRLSGGVRPTLLVLYDNVRLRPEICDSYAISVAMYGIETVVVTSEVVPEGGSILVAHSPAASRRATSRANATLSGIALLSDNDGRIAMQVFHNFFARNPIDPRLLGTPAITHYRLTENPDEVFTEWTLFDPQNP